MIKFATTVKKRIRRFTRDIVRRAPKEWRYPLYRNHVNLSYELPKNLTLKLAETQQELEKAYSLVHDSYIEMGYMDPHNSGMRLGFYNMLPYTSTVIASWDGEVIGTFSVVLNNPARLPIESDFDITYLNRRYSRVAEIIGLTVKKDFRSSHGNILFPLLKYLYNFSYRYLGVDCLVIAVSPSYAELYKGIMMFEQIEDKIIRDPLVNGAPMTGLYLDLDAAPQAFKKVYNHKPDQKNLYKYMRKLELPNLIYPKKEYYQATYSAMSPKLIKYFFRKRVDVIGTLTKKQLSLLNYDIFLHDQFNEFFDNQSIEPIKNIRQARRYPTFCKGAILPLSETEMTVSEENAIRILDVSENGLYGVTTQKLDLRKKYKIFLQISPTKRVVLVGKVIWRQSERIYGFHIVNKEQLWDDFIHYMETQYYNVYHHDITKQKRGTNVGKV